MDLGGLISDNPQNLGISFNLQWLQFAVNLKKQNK